MIEWKERLEELKHEYEESLLEASDYFNLPPILTKDSSDLELIKDKYAKKLDEQNLSEADIAFTLTKLLTPLIEGKYFLIES